MERIKPNKLEIATSQLGKYEGKVKFPGTIKESEKGYFHVLLIRDVTSDKATLTINVKADVQIYDINSWITNKKNLNQVGVIQAFIFHDPTYVPPVKAMPEKKSEDILYTFEDGRSITSEKDISKDAIIEELKLKGIEVDFSQKKSILLNILIQENDGNTEQ